MNDTDLSDIYNVINDISLNTDPIVDIIKEGFDSLFCILSWMAADDTKANKMEEIQKIISQWQEK